jgi:hypothetical protein
MRQNASIGPQASIQKFWEINSSFVPSSFKPFQIEHKQRSASITKTYPEQVLNSFWEAID